ncbi:MAG: hypothetical protein ACE5IP_07915 [Terriglobia bacterium]
MAEGPETREPTAVSARLRHAGLFVLFSLVLLIPKTLGLRRRPNLWNVLRLVGAAAGALLVASGDAFGVPGLATAAGALLMVLAFLVRPAREGESVDEQARELGALIVVNGGRLSSANHKPAAVRLFVAAEHVHVLDLQHRTMLEIPLRSVFRLVVEKAGPSTRPPSAGKLGVTGEAKEAREADEKWKLRVEWQGGNAAFSYEGFFAEHLARVAETTLRSQLRRALPVVR